TADDQGQVTVGREPECRQLVSPESRAPTRLGRLGGEVPWSLLAGFAAAGVLISASLGQIRDIDLYWHLLVGDEIRSGTPITAAGHGWTFAPVPDTWVSSQWLSEVLLSWLHSVGGFQALVLFRVVSAAAVLVVLAAVTLRGRPIRAGAVAFALGGVAIAVTTQERSQQLTYVLAPLVGWWAERLVREGRVPRWWIVLPLTVVWANFHGGWVLLPFVLVLCAVARWTSHGLRDRPAWHAIVLSAGCGLSAMISPLGPANALTAITFSRAAGAEIAEWGRVVLWADQGWMLGALLVLFILCWSRGRTRPGNDELVLVVGLIAFGFLAYRNITPAVLVIAPTAAGAIARALPARPTEPRPRLARTSLTIALVGALLAVGSALLPGQNLQGALPIALFQQIGRHPTPVRVLNTYNVSGPLLFFSGGAPHVKVGIDGRTDLYGAAYINTYMNTLLAAGPGWQWQFDQLNPDAALLYSNEALVGALQNERNWRVVDVQDGVVLLVPPNATGW
ncbi:MAG: hypothetical protein ABI468_04130, partial [Candidatus Nanopelagicales bacterium]